MKRQFVFLLLLCLFFVRALAQQVPVTARFTTANPSRLVGEQINLTLVVEAPADAIVTVPEFPTDWPPFEVQSVGEINKTISGDMATYRQNITVIAWRPGDHATPDTYLQYQLTPDGEALTILAEPSVIAVPSVLVNGDTDLRPLKPPVSLPYLPPWLILVVAIVAVGAVRGIRWWRSRRRASQGDTRFGRAGDMAYSAKERTLMQLRNIRAGRLSPVVVYETVADCLRAYIQRQYGVSALDMTTNELMSALQARSTLQKPHQRDLAKMLEYADLVKFAEIQPGERAVRQLLDTAEKWIEAVEPAINGGETTE
jgi:hypothetical protein